MLKKRTRSEDDVDTSKYFAKKRKLVEPTIGHRLNSKFYNQECVEFAKSLLGQLIVRNTKKGKISCKIVEVESYLADDKASHSFNHKRTPRNEAMFMKPGTLYVYVTYGMYHCMNISSAGSGNAVLIRAAEPVEGAEIMIQNRSDARKSNKIISGKNISNGPSKLCQALSVDKTFDKLDLTSSTKMWIEESEKIPEQRIVSCKRIGLSEKSGVWAEKPLRFYELENQYVSVRNKVAEIELSNSPHTGLNSQ